MYFSKDADAVPTFGFPGSTGAGPRQFTHSSACRSQWQDCEKSSGVYWGGAAAAAEAMGLLWAGRQLSSLVKWKPCGCSWLILIWMAVEKWSRLVVSNSLWPMDCSPPSSSVHGILQAKILEWVGIMYSRPLNYVWVVGQLFSQSKIYI